MKKIGLVPAIAPALIILVILLLPQPSQPSARPEIPPMRAVQTSAVDGRFASAVVMDAGSRDLLAAKEARLVRQPASMVKMMTELLLLESIAAGDLALTDTVTVSANASRMGGSQVYLKQGETFSARELLMAVAIHSANDAAVALAEHHSGNVPAFVEQMNRRAATLGMHDTVFRFVHGLPPSWRQKPDLTTAFDMALLGCALTEHDEALEWASMRLAPFRNGTFTLYNSNNLLGECPGVDGLKTGYHYRAGFCMTTSAVRQGRRLVAVVMGARNSQDRARETARLLDLGFSRYTDLTLVEREGQLLERKLPVAGGKERDVAVAYAQPLTVNVLKDRTTHVAIEVVLGEEEDQQLAAPVVAGQIVGRAVAKLGTRTLGEVPLVALESVARGTLLDRWLR